MIDLGLLKGKSDIEAKGKTERKTRDLGSR